MPEARKATKHLIVPESPIPTTKNCLVKNVNSAKTEISCAGS